MTSHKPTITECVEWYIRRYYWVGKPWEGTIPWTNLWDKIKREGRTHGDGYVSQANKINALVRNLCCNESAEGEDRRPQYISTKDAIAALQLVRETYGV